MERDPDLPLVWAPCHLGRMPALLRHFPDDPVAITAWHRLDARLTTSGQPEAEQLALLGPLGVTHVINLAMPSHEKSLPDEAGLLATLGIGYTSIPVDFVAPQEADYARFCEVMDDLEGQPVHVHCILNLRVSAFLYRWRQDRKGLPAAEARQELERLWRPGGAWARFIGRAEDAAAEHRYPGRDYDFVESGSAQAGLGGQTGLSAARTESR